jgi:NO-binding membrane sensor protein with MHYT domain
MMVTLNHPPFRTLSLLLAIVHFTYSLTPLLRSLGTYPNIMIEGILIRLGLVTM